MNKPSKTKSTPQEKLKAHANLAREQMYDFVDGAEELIAKAQILADRHSFDFVLELSEEDEEDSEIRNFKEFRYDRLNGWRIC